MEKFKKMLSLLVVTALLCSMLLVTVPSCAEAVITLENVRAYWENGSVAAVTFALSRTDDAIPDDIKLYVAIYTEENKMLAIGKAEPQNEIYRASIPFDEAQTGIYGRIFVWNAGAAPYCESERFTVNTLIEESGAAVSNAVYDGLIITEGVGDGEVTLTNVTVNGDFIIEGGGSETISLESCSVAGKVVMAKKTGNAPRLELTATPINNVEIKTAAIIEATDSESVVSEVIAEANIEIRGDSAIVKRIEVSDNADENTVVDIPDGKTVDVEVNSTNGVRISGDCVSVSTGLEEVPGNVSVNGTDVEHIHQWNEWTEQDDTYHVRVCKDKAHVQESAHSWDGGTIINAPTQESTGTKVFVCYECKAENTQTLPELEDKQVVVKESDGNIVADLSDFGYPNYYYEIVDVFGNKAMSGWSDSGEQYISLGTFTPFAETGTNKYSLVVYGCDENYTWSTKEKLPTVTDYLEVTVEGEPVDYEITYNGKGEGIHAVTINGAFENMVFLRQWYIDGELESWGRSTGSTSLTIHQELCDGLVLDLRNEISRTFEDGALKVVMTPPSKREYENASSDTDESEKNIWLEMDGNVLWLVWNDDEGLGENTWYYILENGQDITSEDFSSTDITWLLPGATVNSARSYEIQKGNWSNRETLWSLENALNITVTSDTPEISLAVQADGTYKFISDSDGGYFYRVKTPDGTPMATDYTADGTLMCALYEGCTVEVQAGTIAVAEDAKSADITMSQIVAIENPGLHTAEGITVEVDSLDELTDAVNRGNTAKLTANITSDSVIKFKTGAPAAINLNGYKITAPYVRVYYGKELTVDGSVEGSGISAFYVASYGKLTVNGGEYTKLTSYDARELVMKEVTINFPENQNGVQIYRCDEVNLENSTFTSTGASGISSVLFISNCDSVSLKNVAASGNNNSYGADIEYCDNVSISGGEYIGNSNSGIRILSSVAYIKDAIVKSRSTSALWVQNQATVEISGGAFEAGSTYIIGKSGTISNNVSVLGGTFTSTASGTKYIVSMNDGDIFNICGGTFCVDPTEYVDTELYNVNANADGTYTVTEK